VDAQYDQLLADLLREDRPLDRLLSELADLDAVVRLRASTVLALKGDDRGFREMVRTLRDPESRYGNDAGEVLLRTGEKGLVELLAALTDKEVPFARGSALAVLAHSGEDRAVDAIASVLLDTDEDLPLRRNAAFYLGRTEDTRAVDPLLAALKTQSLDPSLRAAVAKALGELHDPRAIQPLAKLLNDETVISGRGIRTVREMALHALTELGDVGGLEVLRPLLSTGDEDWHGRVGSAVQHLTDRSPR
jgi:HEAT repeat protein